jgi:hypothetical protein
MERADGKQVFVLFGGEPSRNDFTALQRKRFAYLFRRQLKRKGVTDLEAIPNVELPGAQAFYVGKVRVIVQYRIQFDDFILRADVLGTPPRSAPTSATRTETEKG